jgi:Membrane bound O-acyl transferase family
MSTIWGACTSLALGLALLYICLFSLTVPHRSLVYVRLVIAPKAIFYFWDFGYGSYEPPTLMISSAMATIGIYGIMRVFEHTIVSLWDPTTPHWVARAGKNESHPTYSHPQSFGERCFYAFDLLTSQRGASWSTNREWNWSPRRFHSWTPPPSGQFVKAGIRAMLVQYLLVDLLDTIIKSRSWDTTARYPVSSLSVLEQPIFPMCICGGAFLTIDFAYTALSTVCVLCGSSPDSWPPMFDSPFSCTSLSDFWAHRWHWMFRRVFDRLSIPFVCIMVPIIRFAGKGVHQKEPIITVTRTVVIFALSTLLHLFILYRATQTGYHKSYGSEFPQFWDLDLLLFFMSQPVGLFFESAVIIPIANWMVPSKEQPRSLQRASPTRSAMLTSSGSQFNDNQTGTTGALKSDASLNGHRWQRVTIMRLYTWGFLIWTGRWGTDKWARIGFFHENELVVPFSVWRGVWSGKWKI